MTDRDIALVLGMRDARPSEVKVGDVMTGRVVSVAPGADVADVSQRMQQSQVRRILVVEGEPPRRHHLDGRPGPGERPQGGPAGRRGRDCDGESLRGDGESRA